MLPRWIPLLALFLTVPAWAGGESAAQDLPASTNTAKAALVRSPRHGEYADVALPGGGKPIRTWIVYPEREGKAPVVIVIHEIYGLTDWIRAVADRLAADGFIALAPDLLSGSGPGGGGTESVGDQTAIAGLVKQLAPEQIVAQLNAVRAFALELPAAADRSATVGFCWGGAASFAYAAAQPAVDAAVVYYGTPPPAAALGTIEAPVLGLYGGADARVTMSVPRTAAEMKKLGKIYESHIFKDAGHGFLRLQDEREEANLDATERAWPLMLAFLRKHTS